MRSYKINVDRLVNMLIPYYLGGRTTILYLQSCLIPLQTVANTFEKWANEKRTEAAMTSQVILLENYLSKKFSKYFKDKNEMIRISDGKTNGVPFYWESGGALEKHPVVYKESEANKTLMLRNQNERTAYSDISFAILCPAVDTSLITKDELASMISYVVGKYNIAGKKFKVLYT